LNRYTSYTALAYMMKAEAQNCIRYCILRSELTGKSISKYFWKRCNRI